MTDGIHDTGWDFEFESLSHAVRYRAAVAAEFSAFLQGRVLEIGAGIGQMTEVFAAGDVTTEVVGLEPNPRFAVRFRERLPHTRLIEGTVCDLAADEAFDAAVMINVLEHIENDVDQVRQIGQHLRPEHGRLCVLVPARPELYSKIDARFGHFRRYTRRGLASVLKAGGYAVERIHYFNLVGYAAWFARFVLLGSTSFNPSQVAFFDRWLFPPVNRFERHVMRPPVGQSVVAIGRRVA